MANLYRAPFYFDVIALRVELHKHHVVAKTSRNGSEWKILCACGMDTGECSTEQIAVGTYVAHVEAMINPV